jgi:hypothetical protein
LNNKILIGFFCAVMIFLIVYIPFSASSLIENGYLKNPSDFNNVASGIKSIVLAASVFIGGVWSWWKASEYMEHKLSRSIAERELQKLKNRPNIEVELSCSQFFNFDDSGLYIRGIVKLKNNGNFPAFIKYDSPIYITKLELSPEGERKVVQHYREEVITAPLFDKKDGNYELQCLRDQVLDPNCETSTNFIKKVRDPGLYLVEYRVPIDVERQCALEDVGKNMISTRVYSNREYISIQYKGNDVKG